MVALSSTPTQGHALLVWSNPAANTSVSVAPTTIVLRFGEAPDPRLSSVRVLDSSGAERQQGALTVDPSSATTLSVAVDSLDAGVYTVTWRTVSAVDGHLAAGSFAFGVGVPVQPATGAATTSVSAEQVAGLGTSWPGIAVRWLMYAGFALLVGAVLDARVVFGSSARRSMLRVALVGVVAAVIGTVGLVAVQLLDSGADVATAIGSSIGTSAFVRLLPLMVALAALVLFRERGLTVAGIAGVAAIAVTAFLGHAGAGNLPLLNTGVDALHLLAAAAWIGGLVGLLFGLRALEPDARGGALRRFARVATVGLAAVVATGVLRAVAELTAVSDLWTTDFGRLLVLKAALIGIVALLGAINHFRHVPRSDVASVRRNGTFEVGLAAIALLATAALVDLAPPVQVAAASAENPAPQLVVDGADYATTLRLHLAVSPGTVGFNEFDAVVTDYDTGAPVDVNGATLRFHLPTRPDLPDSTLRLAPTGSAGEVSGTGANLGLSGPWMVTALVDRGANSSEVQLQVPVAPPTRPIDVDREPGVPTIYTVHLDKGNSLQVYLDPGTAGPNDVHATFFGPDGNGLAATGITEFVNGAPGSPGALSVRTLEPGHVVGSTTLGSGNYQVEVTAMAPDGTPMDAVIPVTVP
jgi:copper transport protein